MKRPDNRFRARAKYVAVGIILLFALQGCTTPFVDVKVDTCGAGMTDTGSEKVGLCNKKSHGGMNVTGFWDDATGRWMGQTSLTCQSGTVCKSYAGSCTGGTQPCINHYNSSTRGCACACPPVL